MELPPPDADCELEKLAELILAGKGDAQILQRARELGDAVRKEMRAKYGDRSIAAQLIREARGDE